MPIAPPVVRTRSARVDHRFNRIASAFPARMVYLLRALGDRAFLPPSPRGLTMHLEPGRTGCISAGFGASIGRRDHTTSPSATADAEDPAEPRAIRQVPAKTVSSAVRPRAGGSFTATAALRSPARPTLSRPSHPTARS